MNAELFISSRNLLGESPVWDGTRNEFIWVDIEQSQLHTHHVASGKQSIYQFNSLLSAVTPVEGDDSYLLALQDGLFLWNRNNGNLQQIANPEENITTNRFNDGKCDPQGRFWIGSMDCNATPEKGSLYLVDSNLKVKRVLKRVGISNGLAWDCEKRKMYYIDSATYQIVAFDFISETGEIHGQNNIISVPYDHGAPDGMCIDEEGMLWVAHWGGANVTRWNPLNGKILQVIKLPVPHVTSCCFGNQGLDVLYITTARSGLSQDELKKYPESGSVFSVETGIKGKSVMSFNLK